MAEATPVIYVWSASDEERYNRYQNAVRWMLAPIILLGLLMLVVTIWALIEFRSCSWKMAPPTVSLPVLIIFLILSLLTIALGIYGLVAFGKEMPDPLKHFIRAALIFVLLSVLLMIALWIYTCYMDDDKYKRSNMQLAYICLEEVANCWDNVQRIHSCCGWYGPKDWQIIPLSCCNFANDYSETTCNANRTSIPLEMAYQNGCRRHLQSRSLFYILVSTISWALAVVLFLIIVFLGIHLMRGLKIKEKLQPLMG